MYERIYVLDHSPEYYELFENTIERHWRKPFTNTYYITPYSNTQRLLLHDTKLTENWVKALWENDEQITDNICVANVIIPKFPHFCCRFSKEIRNKPKFKYYQYKHDEEYLAHLNECSKDIFFTHRQRTLEDRFLIHGMLLSTYYKNIYELELISTVAKISLKSDTYFKFILIK